MNILVIDEEFPFPLNTGKRIRTFNLTKGLTKYNQVSFLAYGDSKTDSYQFMKDNKIIPFTVPPPDRNKSGIKFYGKLFTNLFSPYPYIVTSHYTDLFHKRLLRLIEENEYDILVCEWTPYALFIKNISSLKKIIVAHNIESMIWQRYYENEKNLLKQWYIKIQQQKVLNFEKNCFQWADGATAVSGNDANIIKTFNLNYEPEVIENGVDLNYFRPSDNLVDLNTLVFTGSMDWRPNQDAVLYFVNEIFPLLKEQRPQIKVFFVGRNPPQHILKLNEIEGIDVTGTVDDVRGYIAKAGLYIVPLRIGGGSRLKILEAMAMKKAIISTTVGAEGLNVKNGVDIILRDKPDDFARAVLETLENQKLRNSFAENGLKLVRQHYGWDKISLKLNNYLEKVVQSK